MNNRWFVLVAGLVIGASPSVSPDEATRQGNEAIQNANAAAALRFYQQAEERGIDPGLIAFNRATAHYLLRQFDEAETHYRQALDDDEIPDERRAKALYNLGNCLMQQAVTAEKPLPRYKTAIVVYEMCLETPKLEEQLRADAMYNLELAKRLWSQARRQSKAADPPTPNDGPEPEPRKEKPPEPPKQSPTEDNGNEPKNPKGKENSDQSKTDLVKLEPKEKPKPSDRLPPPGAGKMEVIRDPGKLLELTPARTRVQLQDDERRLQRERTRLRETASDTGKGSEYDW